MKNTSKLIGIMAIIMVIGFTMVACSTGDDNNGDRTFIYKGINGSGDEYELKIKGDNYELTNGSNKSTGTVIGKVGTTYTLKPSVTATTFTATATPEGLRELSGSITWDNGLSVAALPGQLTASGGSGGNDGDKDPWKNMPGKLTITNFSGSLIQNNYIIVVHEEVEYRDDYITLYFGNSGFGEIQIKGNTITIPVWEEFYSEEEGSYTSVPFFGNITIEAGNLRIYHYKYSYVEYEDEYRNKVPITFTKGNATINFNTQMKEVGKDTDGEQKTPVPDTQNVWCH